MYDFLGSVLEVVRTVLHEWRRFAVWGNVVVFALLAYVFYFHKPLGLLGWAIIILMALLSIVPYLSDWLDKLSDE